MNIVTKIPFVDILLAVGSVALIVWLLWAGFNPKKGDNSSSKSSGSTKSSASKPAGSGINININSGAGGGDNESNTGQSN